MELQRYRVLEKAGEGTHSEVFKALDQETGLLVALKRIRIRKSEDGVPIEFVREVYSLQRVNHPNLIKLSGVFVGKTNINIVYPYYPQNLSQVIEM
jgi:serine/threonine protein kinase